MPGSWWRSVTREENPGKAALRCETCNSGQSRAFPATNQTCTHIQKIKQGKADRRKHCSVSHADLCPKRALLENGVQPSGTDP